MRTRKVKETTPPTALPKAAALLRWYDKHGRDLPWRVKGGKRPDPYKVWLAEIMLQQTTVAAVIPYYAKFLQLWPTVTALAAADLGDIRAAWAGLGYYRRASNLHRCAQVIVTDYAGKFPNTVSTLAQLPGIGTYTSAAVTAIAFDQRANVVDGNVERVMARLFRVKKPLREAKGILRDLAAQLLPKARHGDYAQALMDLGATICTPRQPNCPACPWRKACQARNAGIASQLPVPASKVIKPVRRAVAFWLENAKGEVWLRRRPEEGLLGGMIEVPSSPWLDQDMPEINTITQYAPAKARWQRLSLPIRHNFTHFDLYLEIVYACGRASGQDGFWSAKKAMKSLALPNVMRKVEAAVRNWRK
ncbi:MAG: A/G-specific adenine glycosylase [Alphaproteobacteria bacterium]|nr:A/G-specific adenine glycosylase [Alphaproteobacteria bacterium]